MTVKNAIHNQKSTRPRLNRRILACSVFVAMFAVSLNAMAAPPSHSAAKAKIAREKGVSSADVIIESITLVSRQQIGNRIYERWNIKYRIRPTALPIKPPSKPKRPIFPKIKIPQLTLPNINWKPHQSPPKSSGKQNRKSSKTAVAQPKRRRPAVARKPRNAAAAIGLKSEKPRRRVKAADDGQSSGGLMIAVIVGVAWSIILAFGAVITVCWIRMRRQRGLCRPFSVCRPVSK